MPCHCSLTCRAGEWAPAMSMSLSRSRSALQCKRRARSISALRRAARLLRRPLRTCFLASGAGAGGTGVGGGNACCLGGGMCNERRGPRNHDCTRNDGEEAEEMRVAATPSKKFRRLEGDTAVTKLGNRALNSSVGCELCSYHMLPTHCKSATAFLDAWKLCRLQ